MELTILWWQLERTNINQINNYYLKLTGMPDGDEYCRKKAGKGNTKCVCVHARAHIHRILNNVVRKGPTMNGQVESSQMNPTFYLINHGRRDTKH